MTYMESGMYEYLTVVVNHTETGWRDDTRDPPREFKVLGDCLNSYAEVGWRLHSVLGDQRFEGADTKYMDSSSTRNTVVTGWQSAAYLGSIRFIFEKSK